VKITADTITDEQILDIRAQAARNHAAYGLDTSLEVVRICDRAIAHWGSQPRRAEARARCAEILNARQ